MNIYLLRYGTHNIESDLC